MNAWIAFDESADEVRRLLEIHTTLGGDAKGRHHRLEVLNKSAILLITAIWEAFCEDVAADALEHIVTNLSAASSLPKELKKRIAKDIEADHNELAMWSLADEGWKTKAQSRLTALVTERNRKMNTPNSQNLDEFFVKAIGMTKLSDSWRWATVSPDKAREKLNSYISLRGAIAHRGKASASVTKVQVEEYFAHVRRLADMTGEKVNVFVKNITGKSIPVFPGKVRATGYCRCERRACVGRNRNMYCYWRNGLSPWVRKKRLYWQCYDQKIVCPRCSMRHKRGHIGRLKVCGVPY